MLKIRLQGTREGIKYLERVLGEKKYEHSVKCKGNKQKYSTCR